MRGRLGATRGRSVPRSPIVLAKRAKLKSRRDELIIAQGKRGMSAALGCRRKMISSFFLSGLAGLRRAKPERNKEAGCGGVFPRAAAWAPLPLAIIGLTLWGVETANRQGS